MGFEPHEAPDSRALDRRFAGGVAWSGLSRGVAQLASWASLLVAARLLTPGDVGVVAAATAIAGFISLVTELGLGSAIVAAPEVTVRQAAQLTGFSVLCGVAAWGGMAALGLALPPLLRVPELRTLLPVAGLSLMLSASAVVPIALLRKRLEFRRLALLEAGKSVAQAIALSVLVLLGVGYWSFVWSEIAAGAVVLALVWRSGWAGLEAPAFSELSAFLRFTRDVVISRLAWYAYSNADLAVVGRRLGTAALGHYSIAWTLVTAPSEKVAALIYNVTPGVFAKVQTDAATLRRYVLLLMEGLSLVLFPISAGIAVLAPDLVPLLFGPQWTGAIPIVQVLAALGAVRALSPLTSQIFLARGRTRVLVVYTLLTAALLPAAFWVASPRGPVAVASVWVTLFPLLIAVQLRSAFREIDLPLSSALRAVSASVAGTLAMAAAVLVAERAGVVRGATHLERVLFGGVVGGLAYSACVAVLAGRRLAQVYRHLRFRTLDA